MTVNHRRRLRHRAMQIRSTARAPLERQTASSICIFSARPFFVGSMSETARAITFKVGLIYDERACVLVDEANGPTSTAINHDCVNTCFPRTGRHFEGRKSASRAMNATIKRRCIGQHQRAHLSGASIRLISRLCPYNYFPQLFAVSINYVNCVRCAGASKLDRCGPSDQCDCARRICL